MALNTWLVYSFSVFLISGTPGPNMLLALTQGIRYGLRRSLMTCAGLQCALALMMAASAAGLGVLLAESTWLFTMVKWLGALYLIYLGIHTWRASTEVTLPHTTETQPYTAGQQFRQGFWVALSNPKAFLFSTAFLPQFLDTNRPQAVQFAVLLSTFFVIEGGWQLIYAGSGARLQHWLGTPRHLRILNRVVGVVFVTAGILLTGILYS